MYYGLSSSSFDAMVLQARSGSRDARLFLRLACYATAATLSDKKPRTGQFVLSVEQVSALAADSELSVFLSGLSINLTALGEIQLLAINAQTPVDGTLQLPEKAISEQSLFTTPVWLEDLASGNYGPSIRFGDLIAAWTAEELPLSQLTGIVSIIDLQQGKALMNESHIIAGIGLKGSDDATVDGVSPRAKVELIAPDDWFSLAQFGSVIATIPSTEDAAKLSQALVSNDFSTYSNDQAYLFIADVTVSDNTWIRREFSSALYQEDNLAAPPFSLAKNCKQHLEQVSIGDSMSIIGKIHGDAEAQYGGKLDPKIHIHGISHEVMEVISGVDLERLYQDQNYFSEINAQLVALSQSTKVHCGHLKFETAQCHFQSVQNVRVVQTLPHVIEVSKTGAPTRDLLMDRPISVSKTSQVSRFSFWNRGTVAANDGQDQTAKLSVTTV